MGSLLTIHRRMWVRCGHLTEWNVVHAYAWLGSVFLDVVALENVSRLVAVVKWLLKDYRKRGVMFQPMSGSFPGMVQVHFIVRNSLPWD